jgi:tRNA modification GTPase
MPSPDVLLEDTIVAAATPPGQGAIALIRVSGPDALGIVSRLPGAPGTWTHRRARLLRLSGHDELLATAFLAPGSYTGEDVVELSCHGNMLIVERLLAALVAAGAREAGPGEFTYRAVRNGRMTLAEAERLAHRLRARLPWELDLAETGEDARAEFSALLDQVREARAELESALEFDEGDGPDWEALSQRIRRLATQARLQDRWSRLPRVLLIGPVNAGKSTLFNRLAGFDRALVSERPGTTRDWLEIELRHGGVPFLLIDSAGLRPQDGPAPEPVESEGMRLTRALAEDADVLIVFAGAPDHPAPVPADGDPRVIRVLGKSDLTPSGPGGSPDGGLLPVSGRTGAGVQALLDTVVHRVRGRFTTAPRWWFPSRLSGLALELEADWVRLAAEPLAEVRALHLRELAARLEDQLEVPPADLYRLIFSRFCIGK